MSANACTSISEFPEPKPDYRPVCFGPTGRPTQCGKIPPKGWTPMLSLLPKLSSLDNHAEI